MTTKTEYRYPPPALLEPCRVPASAREVESEEDIVERAYPDTLEALLVCRARLDSVRAWKNARKE